MHLAPLLLAVARPERRGRSCRAAAHARLVVLAIILLPACGRSDRPALGLVTGCVRFDGRPLAGALVLFTPEGPGRTSMGVTDADGRYELTYLRDLKGANVGRHTVRISAAPDQPATASWPAALLRATGTLAATVQPGGNEIDLVMPAGRRRTP